MILRICDIIYNINMYIEVVVVICCFVCPQYLLGKKTINITTSQLPALVNMNLTCLCRNHSSLLVLFSFVIPIQLAFCNIVA
uniref:Uncharacterized protein n=1 Tax=Octopus bimaculoides TaxID=37653 RepID=A0A0L8HLT5_OCTBM